MQNQKQESMFLFQSERLGFRNWVKTDIDAMAEINSDPEVMEFFPMLLTKQQSMEFIERMQKNFEELGFCYYAVEKLEDKELIGFIGINEKTFESDFTPCIDIGWRIKRSEWNKGYASEGALRCLHFAFSVLALKKVVSITPKVNIKSEHLMQKLGMQKVKYFIFPPLKGDARLEECVLYEISAQQFQEHKKAR